MNIINSFRYGEISRLNAGRFDSTFYQNGVFLMRNMISGQAGEARRRPPVKKLVDANDILDIREFTISDSISYTIGLSEHYIALFRYVAGTYKRISVIEYPNKDGEPEISIDLQTAREIRNSQYYTRMYFVHRSFRPFYIDVNPSNDSMSATAMEVILNQDAKKEFWFTPSYVEDSDGNELTNMEKRIVYKNPDDGKWYLDDEFTEAYEYYEKYPPVIGENAYINNYEEFTDDDLLTGEGNWPSVISCINDSIFLAATDNHPQVIWKSRVLGTSQWIEGLSTDSMHDFVRFQSVVTESKDIVDEEDLPMTEMTNSDGTPVYEQSNGYVTWYTPEKDADGNYTYSQRLYWKTDEVNGDEKIFYIDEECTVEYDMSQGNPINKPIMIYDLSNTDKLLKTVATVDFISTSSTAMRFELNSGRQDRIMFIENACGYIIIGTTREEHLVPSSINPTNSSASQYGSFGSVQKYSISPVKLNSSLLFVQRSNVIRELYLYQGYMDNADVNVLNHEMFKEGIVSARSKNTPMPTAYFVMEDGTIRILTYDKNNQIQAFARWDMDDSSFLSCSCIERNMETEMLCLVERGAEKFIGVFDESEENEYLDDGNEFTSQIETTYAEIIDGDQIMFGAFKIAKRAYIRVFNTGRIQTGNDSRQLVRSPELGNDDHSFVLMGSSSRKYSVIIQSYSSEPMNILAYGFEVK